MSHHDRTVYYCAIMHFQEYDVILLLLLGIYFSVLLIRWYVTCVGQQIVKLQYLQLSII
jgi:hypothetical protein